jgi:acyl-CoA dehydrogenase
MPDTSSLGPLLDERHVELAIELERFCTAELRDRPIPEDDDEARREARHLLELLGSSGWLSYAVPEGGEIDRRACCLIREALAAVSPLADAVFALQCLGMQPILLAGQAHEQVAWLEGARRGTAMAAFAMTEESAGSDVSGIETTAVADGPEWVLDGSKRFISNAGIADVYLVLFSTDAEASPPQLSWFVVPADTKGLDFSGPQVMSEPHPLGEITLSSCRVPRQSLVGSAGDGFQLAMRTLNRLRTTVAAAACGMAGRALDEAIVHAQSRRQFGRSLDRFQLIQQKLAVMATELRAARLLTYRSAWGGDGASETAPESSAMAKWYATEVAQSVVDQAVQIHGGDGVLASSPVDRLYRAVRSLRIYEGATEIQQLVVAREILRATEPGAS